VKTIWFGMSTRLMDFDSQVLAFSKDAQAYCDFIDGMSEGKPSDCYSNLLRLLSNLAVSGFKLPNAMPDQDVDDDDHELSHDEWVKIASSISDAISKEAAVLVERYSDNEDQLTRASMLFDDLADIYRDLKNGLHCKRPPQPLLTGHLF